MLRKYILSSILIVFSIVAFSQQSQTLYFMDRLPQSNLVNPARQLDCKLRFSGIIIPIAGQVLPAMHTNYGNNGFAYQDLIQYNSGMDSLLNPLSPGYDFSQLLGQLKDVNFITLEEHIDIVSFGMKWKNGWDFTFNLANKTEARLNFSKDIAQIVADGGNGDTFSGNTAQLGKFGVTAVNYHEMAFGASKKINNQWTIGAKAKLLFGQQNMWTKKSDLTWHTDETTYDYYLEADMEVRTSQSFYEIEDMYYDYANDSMIFEGNDLEPSVSQTAFRFDNLGVAFDLGAEYNLNDKITLYASLIDLGFIHWKNNVNVFNINGNYTFDGFNIQPAMISDSVGDEYATEQKQEVIKIFFPDRQVDSYNSMLTPKFYVGGTYQFNDWINAGLLYRGAVFQNHLHSSLTFSGNASINKWFSANLSYSMMYNSYVNVGIGLVAKAKFAQFYIVTDNIWGEFFPHNTRNINIRMGINLVFGCQKEGSNTLVGKSDL
jgi:hypothetical protein